jgi:serine O-acetyltransferase
VQEAADRPADIEANPDPHTDRLSAVVTLGRTRMLSILDRVREDVRTAFAKDPAAKDTIEVLLAYPGLHAIWTYRLANVLWEREHHLAGRLLSHVARFLTGVEIHPGAAIGDRFFIDHGAGVVIGETTEIGDDAMLYQGVTLGGDSLEDKKRHPTLEDGVTIGSNATVLGPITIGEGASVGAGSVVLESVPPNCTVVGNPAKLVGECQEDESIELGSGFPD